MDESELTKIGMEVALRPITEITENALGVLGGDWLSEVRIRNRAKLRQNTKVILTSQGIKDEDEVEVSPAAAIPLLAAAQDQSEYALQDLWARLLAALMNPTRKPGFRKEFIPIAEQFEPLDTAVLPRLANESRMAPTRAVFIATNLGVPVDQVMNSLQFLTRVGLAFDMKVDHQIYPQLTPLGRQFLATVAD